jgi:hypothetical protein
MIPGCGQQDEGPMAGTSQAVKLVCGGETVVTLYSETGGVPMGTVTVKNDETKLYVSYETASGYVLVNTRVHVARKLKSIPHTKLGKLRPNQFNYKNVHKMTFPTTFTRSIFLPKKVRTPGTVLYVAAFAQVGVLDSGGKLVAQYRAWANKGFFTYTVQECFLDVELPPGAVNMVPRYPGTTSHWVLNLSGIKEPHTYDVWNGAWPGWCVEKLTTMVPNRTYTAKLVSSQDQAGNLDRAKNVNWQLVNYLLNHKHPKASLKDIQDAIWHLLGYIGAPTDPEAVAMVLDARKNGVGFRPTYGDVIAVVFMNDVKTQLVFLEVSL